MRYYFSYNGSGTVRYIFLGLIFSLLFRQMFMVKSGLYFHYEISESIQAPGTCFHCLSPLLPRPLIGQRRGRSCPWEAGCGKEPRTPASLYRRRPHGTGRTCPRPPGQQVHRPHLTRTCRSVDSEGRCSGQVWKVPPTTSRLPPRFHTPTMNNQPSTTRVCHLREQTTGGNV